MIANTDLKRNFGEFIVLCIFLLVLYFIYKCVTIYCVTVYITIQKCNNIYRGLWQYVLYRVHIKMNILFKLLFTYKQWTMYIQRALNILNTEAHAVELLCLLIIMNELEIKCM